MNAQRPVVLYIAGSGRSGSTLLERMIGGIPGFVNVGELIDLAVRVQPNDELCGCGERFSQCPFWTEVGRRAFDGWNQERVTELAEAQWALARQRQIPAHMASLPGKRARRFRYQQMYADLYEAIASVAGVRCVVDASKRPAQAIALAGGAIDLRICHITRDVRGVAWSMAKRSRIRPHAPESAERMYRLGLTRAAGAWTLDQAETNLLRAFRVPIARMRYEDLMKDARSQVDAMLRQLGLPQEPGDLSHLGATSADLGSSHGLSGNPGRFSAGVTDLRLDAEWQTSIPRVQRAALGLFQVPDRISHRRAVRASRSSRKVGI